MICTVKDAMKYVSRLVYTSLSEMQNLAMCVVILQQEFKNSKVWLNCGYFQDHQKVGLHLTDNPHPTGLINKAKMKGTSICLVGI